MCYIWPCIDIKVKSFWKCNIRNPCSSVYFGLRCIKCRSPLEEEEPGVQFQEFHDSDVFFVVPLLHYRILTPFNLGVDGGTLLSKQLLFKFTKLAGNFVVSLKEREYLLCSWGASLNSLLVLLLSC